jgi:hypothetical protein
MAQPVTQPITISAENAHIPKGTAFELLNQPEAMLALPF